MSERVGGRMNRAEVIFTIKKVGNHFGRVMECLVSREYAAGYHQAVCDMARLFAYAPMETDYAAEREGLLERITKLREDKKRLKTALKDRNAIIEKLLQITDVADAFGVRAEKRM